MLTTTYHLVRSYIPTTATPTTSIYPHLLKGCVTTLDSATSVALLVIAAIANEKARNNIPSALLKEIPHSITDLSKRYDGMIWAACALASVGLQLFCTLALKNEIKTQNTEQKSENGTEQKSEDGTEQIDGPENISPPAPRGPSPTDINSNTNNDTPQYEDQNISRSNPQRTGLTDKNSNTNSKTPEHKTKREIPNTERKINKEFPALKKSASVESFFAAFPQAKQLLSKDDSFKGKLFRQVSTVKYFGGPSRSCLPTNQQQVPPTPVPQDRRVTFQLRSTILQERIQNLQKAQERQRDETLPKTDENPIMALRRTKSFPSWTPIKYEDNPDFD